MFPLLAALTLFHGAAALLPGPATGYSVAPDSHGNLLLLNLDLGTASPAASRIEVSVAAHPEWIQCGEPLVTPGSPWAISLPFSAKDVPPGTSGQLVLRVAWGSEEQGTAFVYRHLVQLNAGQAVPREQRGSRLTECCLSESAVLDPGPEPGGPALYGAMPNPSAADASILLRTPASLSGFSLTIFDVRGRVVHRTKTPHLEAGLHRIIWDGRQPNGAPAPSGVYLCVVSAEGWTASTKLIRVQ